VQVARMIAVTVKNPPRRHRDMEKKKLKREKQ
jgi:hypothetical protein